MISNLLHHQLYFVWMLNVYSMWHNDCLFMSHGCHNSHLVANCRNNILQIKISIFQPLWLLRKSILKFWNYFSFFLFVIWNDKKYWKLQWFCKFCAEQWDSFRRELPHKITFHALLQIKKKEFYCFYKIWHFIPVWKLVVMMMWDYVILTVSVKYFMTERCLNMSILKLLMSLPAIYWQIFVC